MHLEWINCDEILQWHSILQYITTAIYNNMGKLKKHNIEQKNPDPKEHIFC